jgi:hypothetical protein
MDVSYGNVIGAKEEKNITETLTSIPETVPNVTKETWNNTKKQSTLPVTF